MLNHEPLSLPYEKHLIFSCCHWRIKRLPQSHDTWIQKSLMSPQIPLNIMYRPWLGPAPVPLLPHGNQTVPLLWFVSGSFHTLLGSLLLLQVPPLPPSSSSSHASDNMAGVFPLELSSCFIWEMTNHFNRTQMYLQSVLGASKQCGSRINYSYGWPV